MILALHSGGWPPLKDHCPVAMAVARTIWEKAESEANAICCHANSWPSAGHCSSINCLGWSGFWFGLVLVGDFGLEWVRPARGRFVGGFSVGFRGFCRRCVSLGQWVAVVVAGWAASPLFKLWPRVKRKSKMLH